MLGFSCILLKIFSFVFFLISFQCHVFSLIPTITLGDGYSYYVHFTDRETKILRSRGDLKSLLKVTKQVRVALGFLIIS